MALFLQLVRVANLRDDIASDLVNKASEHISSQGGKVKDFKIHAVIINPGVALYVAIVYDAAHPIEPRVPGSESG